MPRWLKVLLVIGASGGLLLGLAIGSFAWWLTAHRRELREKGISVEAEGKAYGVGKSAHTCIDESLTRLERTPGIVQSALLRMFVKGCLESATHDPALCLGVPATSDMFQSAIWRTNACTEYGKRGDEACANLLGAIQEFCHPPR
jgi:hypothetical protein